MNTIEPKSLFSFCLFEGNSIKSENLSLFDSSYNIGGYTLYTDSRTLIDYAKLNSRELIIFGYAVDVFSGQREKLAETVLKLTDNFEEVINYEKKLGGKYVIFYEENGRCYCLGDATCSVPVFYSTKPSDFICCSNPKFISDILSLSQDSELLKIRKSGHLNQAMPFNVTTYSEIKQLIPNHYVDFKNQKSGRFVNSYSKQKEISPKEAAEITAPMIEKIASFYSSLFEIYCPLTAGRDSRVVYSFLKNAPAYTVWQDRFKNDNQDWVIPEKLTALNSKPYKQIYHEEIAESERNAADSFFGKNGYPDDAFRLALTVNKHFGHGAIIEGDIIGQVGKCSLHRDIPGFLATAGYFRCKLHNYSKESKKLLQAWLDEIKQSKEKINTFDLFSIENRLGRWAAQTHIVQNYVGQLYVNIFNSRSIIYTWTSVSRKKRKNSEIHISLINIAYPELLSVPFEQDKSSLVLLAKMNGITYYLASYAKYFIQKGKFKTELK